MRRDIFAVSDDGDVVAEPHDLFHAVRNIDDRGAALPQPADDLEEDLGLAVAERGSRLVENDDLGIMAQAFGDLDELSLGNREIADLLRNVDGKSEVGYDPVRLGDERLVVDEAETARLARGEDILSDRQIVAEAQFLEDDRQPERGGLLRVGGPVGLPVENDLS